VLTELLSRKLAVDTNEEERSGDVNATLSSLRMSPIGSDDILKVDLHDGCHPDCAETSEKVTVDVDDIFVNVNASSAESLRSSCENPVTNLA